MITIIGAGMAGLVAAGMLREASVLEQQESLPNNHSAVLRFRSSVVGDVLGIPFKRVDVMKAVHPWLNPVADALMYSRKTNGDAMLRSVVTAKGEIESRYIAPPDFIERLGRMCASRSAFGIKNAISEAATPVISTIPMPALMKALDYPETPDFRYVKGININLTLEGVDAYATVYVPDPDFMFNRVSLTGNKMTIEIAVPDGGVEFAEVEQTVVDNSDAIIGQGLALLGLTAKKIGIGVEITRQQYSKIIPINNDVRQRFIMWASENHGIYSLGRFATWRPGLLMDDVVKDVRVIQGLIDGGTRYLHKKKGNV